MKLYKLIKKPPFFIQASFWMTKADHPIKSGPNARNSVIIPLLIAQYGNMKDKFAIMPVLGHTMFGSFKELFISAKSLRNNPHIMKKYIDEELLREFEEYAYKLGITGIGYTKVNPNYIFKGFEILYDNAIMLTMVMNKDAIATNPSIEANREIFRTYYELGKSVNKLADFLRKRGYDCHPSPAIGGDINTVPTAQDANLGYIGKNGILITPEYGPCVRLAAIFLEIENLPFSEKNEHEWVRVFCNSCNKCVRSCPAGAIYLEPKVLEDGTNVFIDLEKCAKPFSKGCSECISSCVFTNVDYNKVKAGFSKTSLRSERH